MAPGRVKAHSSIPGGKSGIGRFLGPVVLHGTASGIDHEPIAPEPDQSAAPAECARMAEDCRNGVRAAGIDVAESVRIEYYRQASAERIRAVEARGYDQLTACINVAEFAFNPLRMQTGAVAAGHSVIRFTLRLLFSAGQEYGGGGQSDIPENPVGPEFSEDLDLHGRLEKRLFDQRYD